MKCSRCDCSIASALSCGWRICDECHKAHQRVCYENARKERLAYAAKRYVQDRVRILAARKQYVFLNKDKVTANNRAYYRANKDVYFAAARNRDALKRSTVPGDRLTAEQWNEILEVFDHRCAYCLQQGPMTMDHVIALSRGGTHTSDNVVPACLEHNLEKRAKPVFFMTNAA